VKSLQLLGEKRVGKKNLRRGILNCGDITWEKEGNRLNLLYAGKEEGGVYRGTRMWYERER